MRRSLGAIVMLGSLFLVACQSGTADDGGDVEMLGGADQCGRDKAALEWIEAPSELPGGVESIAAASERALGAGDPVLLVHLGQRPTPGYGAALQGAAIADGRLQIDLEAQTPDPGVMLAQVITRPCVALRIPSTVSAKGLLVSMDVEGFPLTHRMPD